MRVALGIIEERAEWSAEWRRRDVKTAAVAGRNVRLRASEYREYAI